MLAVRTPRLLGLFIQVGRIQNIVGLLQRRQIGDERGVIIYTALKLHTCNCSSLTSGKYTARKTVPVAK